MPLVPVVQKTVETRALPAATFNSSLRAPKLSLPEPQYNDAPARGAQTLAAGVANLGAALGEVALTSRKRGDEIMLNDAKLQLDDWKQKNLYGDALFKQGKDAFDLPNTMGAKYDEFTQKIHDGLANDDQKMKFAQIAAAQKDDMTVTLYNHERQQMDSYAQNQNNAVVDSSINLAASGWNNPAQVENAIKDARDSVAGYGAMFGQPPEAIKVKQQEAESKARLAVLTRMADADPKGAVDYFGQHMTNFSANDLLQAQRLIVPTEKKYKATSAATAAMNGNMPALDQPSAINFVMNTIEGGGKVVPDGGGVSKYGINSKKQNFTEDYVKNLTPEQATAFYNNLWTKSKIDDLPANMRLVAFDTIVNHGPGKGQILIDKANNDPQKLLEVRAEEYQRLAKAGPALYGPSLPGWLNRLNQVGAQVGMAQGEPPSLEQMYKQIDSTTPDLETATAAKQLVKQTLDAHLESVKQSEKSASDEAYKYKLTGQEVPLSVVGRMNPKEVTEMQNSQPDPALYESLRSAVTSGQPIDLSQYRWRLGGKYDDLVQIQNDPAKTSNARKVDDVIKNANGILLGKSAPKDAADFTKLDNFRRAVDTEIDAFQKNNGKAAGAAEVQKITDQLLLKVQVPGSLWGNNDVRVLDLKRDDKGNLQQFQIPGIPNDGREFKMLAKDGSVVPAGYPQVAETLFQYATARNLPMTPESLAQIYKALISKGYISQVEKSSVK